MILVNSNLLGEDIAEDLTSNDNHGTIYGAGQVAGQLNQALQFNGIDDYVDIPHIVAFDFVIWTHELWLYRDSDSGAWEQVYVQGDGAATEKNFQVSINDGIAVSFRDTLGVNHSIFWDVEYTAINEWIHFAWSFDGTFMRLYKNGVLVATSGDQSAYTPRITTRGYWLGRRQAQYNFNGRIDEFRIWNTVRTETQIRDNMNTELVGNESGLVGYWPLNERFLRNEPSLVYGVEVSSTSAVNGIDAELILKINDIDITIPITASVGIESKTFTFPAPVKCQAVKANMTYDTTSMNIFYGV